MLKAQDIINGLQKIVNQYSMFAIIWHVCIYALFAPLLAMWRPTNQLLVLLLSLPAISVAVFAWITGNPFNGATFAVLAILIIILGFRTSDQLVLVSQLPFAVAGIAIIVFGLVYPHFIEANSALKYLYASPFGLIPCPTLSVLIGFALLYSGFGSQSLTLILIFFGLFYGIFGVLKLGVYLDLFLVLGTITLLAKYLLNFRTI
jgi:hypothetical protein